MISSFIAGALAFVTSIFGGAGGSSAVDTVEAAPAPATEQVQVAPVDAHQDGDITREEALEIAYERAGVTEAQVTHFDDVEHDRDDGRRIWELEFIADGYEHEFDIDAKTGDILEYERDREGRGHATKQGKDAAPPEKPAAQPIKQPAAQPAPAPAKAERISLERAIEIALNHAGVSNPQWDDRELDSDDGRLYYELEFDSGGFEYEYDIDAYTGEILDVEKEYDD